MIRKRKKEQKGISIIHDPHLIKISSLFSKQQTYITTITHFYIYHLRYFLVIFTMKFIYITLTGLVYTITMAMPMATPQEQTKDSLFKTRDFPLDTRDNFLETRCADARSECAAWKRNGYCQSPNYTAQLKKQNCAKTCKLC